MVKDLRLLHFLGTLSWDSPPRQTLRALLSHFTHFYLNKLSCFSLSLSVKLILWLCETRNLKCNSPSGQTPKPPKLSRGSRSYTNLLEHIWSVGREWHHKSGILCLCHWTNRAVTLARQRAGPDLTRRFWFQGLNFLTHVNHIYIKHIYIKHIYIYMLAMSLIHMYTCIYEGHSYKKGTMPKHLFLMMK
jgi:hypothetical protein